jgi:hypothetical protein
MKCNELILPRTQTAVQVAQGFEQSHYDKAKATKTSFGGRELRKNVKEVERTNDAIVDCISSTSSRWPFSHEFKTVRNKLVILNQTLFFIEDGVSRAWHKLFPV